MPAAPGILKAAVPHAAGIVGVAGPGLDGEIGIVSRAGVGVFDYGAQGRAGGLALISAGEDAGAVGLLPGGGQRAFARGAAGQLGGDKVLVQRKAGGQTRDGHANGGAVGLTENHIIQGETSSNRPPSTR
ncbi:hypothetical protein SDC9_114192 [bioreactor metagenome]|uniref:Uncharacterized protein n=1 Tax=bioreactor metagenome TaxID=1076179 RepID=A0A645BPB1_9ZZZZ